MSDDAQTTIDEIRELASHWQPLPAGPEVGPTDERCPDDGLG